MRAPHYPPPSNSDPPPSGGVVALSVADYRGITIAVHKLESEDVHWKTIGSNLIAYWAGDAGSINCYLKVVRKKFPDTRRVNFLQLINFNQTSDHILPMDRWTSGTITVNVRDRYLSDNLLKMRISKNSIEMEAMSINASAIGSGAAGANVVLNNLSSFILCSKFDEDESLREHVVSKALHKAMSKGKCKQGYCEIVRGDCKQPWTTVKVIDSKDLRWNYRRHHK